MAVLLAALSSVAFGSGDLVGGIAIRRSGRPDAAVATASISSVVAAVICGLALLVAPPDRLTGNDVAWAAAAGLIMTVTRPLLYLGMARGPVTVFAPGYGLAAINLPAVVGPMVGQGLVGWEVFGVLVALPAVALLSGEGRLLRPAEVVRSHVLGLALLVGTSIGLSGLFYSFIDEAAGLAPAAIAMTVGAVLLPAYAAARPAPTPYRSVGVPAVALGGTTAVAFMLSTAAYQRGVAAVVTALICLAPGVSILLAWRFLGERVARLQLVGGLLGVVVVVCFALAA